MAEIIQVIQKASRENSAEPNALVNDDGAKRELEPNAMQRMQQEIDRLKARNAKPRANLRNSGSAGALSSERGVEPDVTPQDKSAGLDPDGYELAALAHDLMGDWDWPLLEEGETVDGDEEYDTPEDDR